MPVKPFDNTNLLQMCRDCGAVGFVPALAYTFNTGIGDVVVTNSSTIPSGDTLRKVLVRLVDQFGGEVRGHIDGSSGGDGYTSAPVVAFSGGGGSGAAGTAVISNGRVTGVTITAPGTGYTSAPTISFTGGGGSGAAGTVVLSGSAVASVTMAADDNAVTLSATTLNTSKPISIMATILTAGQIAADGGAYYIQAAGTLASWDVQKNS